MLRTVFKSFTTVGKIEPKRIFMFSLNAVLEIVNSFVFSVLFFKFLFESLFERKSFTEVAVILLVQLVWQIFYGLYREWYSGIYTEKSNARIREAVYAGLFDKTVAMDMRTLESPEYRDTFRLVMDKSANSMLSIVGNLFSYVKSIALLVLSGGLLATYEPILFIPAVLGVVCSFAFEVRINRCRVEKNKVMNPLFRRFEYIKRVFRSADHALDIKTTGIFNVLLKSTDEANGDIQRNEKIFNKKISALSTVSAVLGILFTYVPYAIVCIKAIVTKAFTSGELAVMIEATGSVKGALRTIIRLYPSLQENSMYAEDYFAYLSRRPEIEANEGGEEPEKKANGINIRNISFSYDGKQEVLKDVSMNIAPGEKVAIVGRNGVGKSTLVKLILQLYRPQSGEIDMDGKPAAGYALKAYRERFGVAFQNTRVYAVSVAENVLMEAVDSEEAGVKARTEEALKRSKLYDRIEKEDAGIASVLTKEFDGNGVELSGGQAQKLALSRVFAKDCGVVVLDEPSAALDPVSEAEMYESMLDISDGKTVILISHRLSACRKVDRIYVLDDGAVAEEGTHEELVSRGGIYAQMWRLQAEGYADSVAVNG